MALQHRPMGTDEPLYTPARDLAYCFEDLVEQAVATTFEPGNLQTWLGKHAQEYKLRPEQLHAGLAAYIEGIRNFRSPDYAGCDEAMRAAGFWDHPEPVKVAVFAAVGLIVTNYYLKCVREALGVPYRGNKPKIVMATPETVEILEAGRAYIDQDRRRLDAMERAKEEAAKADPLVAEAVERSRRIGW